MSDLLTLHALRDYYLTSAGWIGFDNLMVAAVWMRRAQNLSIVTVCSSPNWTCVEVGHTPDVNFKFNFCSTSVQLVESCLCLLKSDSRGEGARGLLAGSPGPAAIRTERRLVPVARVRGRGHGPLHARQARDAHADAHGRAQPRPLRGDQHPVVGYSQPRRVSLHLLSHNFFFLETQENKSERTQ